jgi:hypothetical protein
MPARRRDGVRSRPLPDYYPDDLVAFRANSPLVAGQVPVAGVYNNATDGTIFKIYSLQLFSTSLMDLNFQWAIGKPLPTYTVAEIGSINPLIGTTWGISIAGTVAVCLGNHRSGVTLQQNGVMNLYTGFPLAIVPPHYSFLVEGATAGTAINVAGYFLQCAS